MQFRQGRHSKNLIYTQLGAEPADTDPLAFVAVGGDPGEVAGDAEAVVTVLNEHFEELIEIRETVR